MNIYLQLNEQFIIMNVIDVDYNVISPLYIPYHELDLTLIGKFWDGESAVESPYAVPLIISKLDFRYLFTIPEKVHLYSLASTDPVIQIYLDELALAGDIDLSKKQLIDGVYYLMSKGVLTSERVQQILNNEAP